MEAGAAVGRVAHPELELREVVGDDVVKDCAARVAGAVTGGGPAFGRQGRPSARIPANGHILPPSRTALSGGAAESGWPILTISGC